MSALTWGAPWWGRPAELRVDVDLPQTAIDNDLRRLQQRLQTPGDKLHQCETLPSPLPGLRLRHRVADGEHYVYVQDITLGCLAGFTVFNRLIELDRHADRVLRSPHSRYAPAYQGRGVASAVYRWALQTGMCLISGPRQSPGAYALWRSLSRQYPLCYVSLQDKRMGWLGTSVSQDTLDDFPTRLVLLGAGWAPQTFVRRSRCQLSAQPGFRPACAPQ